MLNRREKQRETYALKNLLEHQPEQRARLRRLVYRCPNKKRCALLEVYVSVRGVYAMTLGGRQSLDHMDEKLELGGIDPADYEQLSDLEKRNYFRGNVLERVKEGPVSQFDVFRLACPHSDYMDVTHEQILQHLDAGRKNIVIQLSV